MVLHRRNFAESDNGWPGSWLLLAFVVVAPLIYFGPQLRAVEAWFVDVYRAIDSWVTPVRNCCSGRSRSVQIGVGEPEV